MAAVFGPVSPKTRRIEVSAILRDAIVTGRLRPGQHLKEIDISQQMKVSRSPVREAFRQLEQEGLLVSIPNQGCYVKEFSAQEIRELYVLRAALENLAFETILKDALLRPENIVDLEHIIAEQQRFIDGHDYAELAHMDMRFHEYLCELSGLSRLVEMWRSLRGQILMLFFQRFYQMDWVPATVIPHHRAILDGLRAGDFEALRRLNNGINEQVSQECIDLLIGPSSNSNT